MGRIGGFFKCIRVDVPRIFLKYPLLDCHDIVRIIQICPRDVVAIGTVV